MRKKVKILALLMALALLVGCGPVAEVKTDSKGDYFLTSEMDEGTKKEIDTIIDAFQAALTEKDASKIEEFLDKDFAVGESELNAFFAEATAGGKDEYRVFDTYYVDGIKDDGITVRIKKSEDSADYIMVTPGSEELCAVLLASQSEDVSQMITLLIGDVSGGRKIVWIDTADYSYYGKTAPEYYDLAKKAKDDKREFSAYIYAQMMYGTSQPGNLYYYAETDDMIDYAHEISAWGQDKFPMEVGNRKIHAINTELVNFAVVPMILYQTDADIGTEEFKADAEALKDAFIRQYPYIAEDFDRIVIRGTNADPQTASEQFDSEKVEFELK